MYVLRVKIPGTKKGQSFTYHHENPLPSGALIEIEFRGKITRGLVLSSTHIKELKGDIKNANFKIKPIEKHLGMLNVNPKIFDTMAYLSKYFVMSEEELCDTLIPSALFLEKPVPVYEDFTSKKMFRRYILQTDSASRISHYKSLVREDFAQKESVCVVVPTAKAAENLSSLLSTGLTKYAYTLHGDLSQKEIKKNLANIVNETHPILLVTTPRYLALGKQFKTIIVEDESSSLYFMEPAKSVDARVYIESLASLSSERVILSDTLVRAETYGRYTFLELEAYSKKPSLKIFDQVKVLDANKDLNKETKSEEFQTISNEGLSKIESLLEEKKKVLVFTLRKGLATQIICSSCGTISLCENCSAPYMLREKNEERELFCNKCHNSRSAVVRCEKCDNWDLRSYGVGVEKVHKELETRFGDFNYYYADDEKASFEDKVSDWKSKRSGLLLATPSILETGISCDDVFVVSIDSLLSYPSYNNSERALDLLSRLNDLKRDTLIIQTRLVEHGAIKAVTKGGNLENWYKEELDARLRYNYPPFYRIVTLLSYGSATHVGEKKSKLKDILSDYNPDFIVRKSGQQNYTLSTVLKVPSSAWPKYKIDSKFDAKLLNILFDEKGLGDEIFVDR